jgi:hypothetical protein
MHPKYAVYISQEQRQGIRDKIQRIVDLLGSPDVAIDDRHAPKLYSHFLENLLATPLARVDASPAHRRTGSKRNGIKQRTSSPAASPGAEYSSYFEVPQTRSAPTSHWPSPTAPRASLSPPPVATSFGKLPASPASAYLDPQSLVLNQDNPNFFNPPLAFDDELMQTMQSAVDQSFWQGVMPGALRFVVMSSLPTYIW